MTKIKIIALLLFVSYAKTSIAQIDLTSKTVLQKQVTIKIPKGFKELDAAGIIKKYGRYQAPNVVFSNDKGDVTLMLTLKSTQVSQEELIIFQKNYSSIYNSYRIDKTKNSNDIITVNNHKIGVFKLKMPTRMGKVYMLMFYTNIGNQMLTAAFSCPINEQKKWQTTADKILKSLITKEI